MVTDMKLLWQEKLNKAFCECSQESLILAWDKKTKIKNVSSNSATFKLDM